VSSRRAARIRIATWAIAVALAAFAVGIPSAAAVVNTPTITGSTPTSPADNNNPVLRGTADAGATVDVFSGSCLGGTPVGTTTADASGTFHLQASVADDTTTTFFATATIPPETSPCSAPFPYLEDSTAPTTSLAPAPPVTGPDTSFSFSGSDAGSGVAGFECQLDAGGFTACSNPKNYTGLSAGGHTFSVRAMDNVGHVDPAPANSTWTVDTVSPNVTFTAKPPVLTNQTRATFAFSADKVGSSFECSLDGAAFTACLSPKVYTGLGNGPHGLAVHAIWLGLVGPPSQYSWTVDVIAPQTTIGSAPPAASTSATATFTFTASEPSAFICRLDGGGPSPCTSPKTYTGLGDGRQTFSVQAVDRAGNGDRTPARYSWRISGVGPPAGDLRPPANVARLRRSVGYGVMKLRWRRPADSDFDHVAVFVTTKPGVSPRSLVYRGRRQSYVNRRFQNGLDYRYLVVSYDKLDNASRGVTARVPPSALLRTPHEGQIVRSAPRLRWTPVRKATYYNVQLYYRGHKVLSAWPARARQALKHRWSYSGRQFVLRRGPYSWFVWPGFGSRTEARYGPLLGLGTFKVR
jgi:hypothetical protein